jgi:hypothetical protein
MTDSTSVMPKADSPERTGLSEQGLKLALSYFDHVEKQVSLATTTSQITVAATALLIGVYINVVKDHAWTGNTLFTVLGLILALSGICLGIGFVLALLAAFPNLRTGWAEKDDIRSVFYFRTVADMSLPSYIAEFVAKDKASSFDVELLNQIYGKSIWLKKMFRRVQRSIMFIVVGTVLILAVSLVVYGQQSWIALQQKPSGAAVAPGGAQ